MQSQNKRNTNRNKLNLKLNMCTTKLFMRHVYTRHKTIIAQQQAASSKQQKQKQILQIMA